MGKLHERVKDFEGNRVKSEHIIFLFERENDFVMRKQLEMNFAARCETRRSGGGRDGSLRGVEVGRGGFDLLRFLQSGAPPSGRGRNASGSSRRRRRTLQTRRRKSEDEESVSFVMFETRHVLAKRDKEKDF